jgi:hypothetical protein
VKTHATHNALPEQPVGSLAVGVQSISSEVSLVLASTIVVAASTGTTHRTW